MNPSIDLRRTAVFSAVLIVIGVAWWGRLDRLCEEYVSSSLLDAGIIYGTARGINALVSAQQGTELDLWLVTFSIGELLDPVNDLIERFSGVMTIAIASLVIQQLLLVILSHTSFTVALTLLGLAVAIAWFVSREYGYRPLLKAFFAIAFLRFALSLVLLGNAWVDVAFLPDSSAAEFQVMQEFESDLEGVNSLVRGEGERSAIAQQFERLQTKVTMLADSSLRLMGALLLKSVIIPLLFFWALLAVCRLFWRGGWAR